MELKPLRACVWKLPKTVKGKQLQLTLTAVYQGARKTIRLPVTPR
jgi:hypothetical protein